jgi:hypothetical protein
MQPENPLETTPGLLALLRACLEGESPSGLPHPPIESIAHDTTLPWLAHRLHESGALASQEPDLQAALRDALRSSTLLHLDSEAELQRLAELSGESGLRFLVFKGHALARSLYPVPASRPTGDFDILVDGGELETARRWLARAGYVPIDPFAGTVWLGAQNWDRPIAGKDHYHVDLHWDYTSRMYFRMGLEFDALWAASKEVGSGGAAVRIPCPGDNLVIACIHLAAFDPGLKIRTVWLLDVFLLMRSLGREGIEFFLERAATARATEACLAIGEMAADLGPPGALDDVLAPLRAVADERRWHIYQRTLRNRALDLAAYWVRLDLSDKLRFFGEMARWVAVRGGSR